MGCKKAVARASAFFVRRGSSRVAGPPRVPGGALARIPDPGRPEDPAGARPPVCHVFRDPLALPASTPLDADVVVEAAGLASGIWTSRWTTS